MSEQKSPNTIYLSLFHGRTDPRETLEDWGTEGPWFGPLDFVHTTYGTHIKFQYAGRDSEAGHDLHVVGDMVYYNGVYYGDWSVCTGPAPDGRVEEFDPERAKLPERPAEEAPRTPAVEAIRTEIEDFLASNFFMGESPLNEAEVETLAEAIADRLKRDGREVHVLVKGYSGVLQSVEVFTSRESAARFFVEQMKGKHGEPLDGFKDVNAEAFGDGVVAYADVLYEAHREAFNEGSGDGTDWHWYETAVKP